ncbi:MAG TPA: hypothetical protein VKD71_09945 [Gemmataceae bacterium]|nr:hypothetical protein [Gemmataceae bacterium]
MTGIKLTVFAAALALVGAGCSAEISDSAHQPPRPASKTNRGSSPSPPPDDRARDATSGQVLAQKANSGEGYVIIGNDDNPKAVKADVTGGKGKASTGKPARPAPEPPKPEEPTFTVTGEFLSTKEKAREDAIREAAAKVHQYLLEQDPPITRMPTTEMVRKMLLTDQEVFKDEQITVEGKTETRYQATVAVKVRPEHMRALRSRDRSSEALWVLAGLAGLAGVVAVFFRIDAWTKGYLTSWLVLGTVGTATLLGGLWWWAK